MPTLLVLPALALAKSDAYIACVQQQLLQMALDAGPSDGLIGGKIRAAVAKLLAQNSALAPLPPLSVETASVWCRALGVRFDLRDAWPSRKVPFVLQAESTVTTGKRRLLERSVAEARRALLSKLEVEIPGTLSVVAAQTRGALVSQTQDALAALGVLETRSGVARQLSAQCDGRTYLSGASYGGVVALCNSPKFATAQGWGGTENRSLRRLISHELSHEIHAQLVGNYRKAGGTKRTQMRGPKWLVEATAIALELDFAVPELSAAQQVSWFERQQSYDGQRLKSLSAPNTKVDRQLQLYAGYAGVLLASRAGHAAIGQFWLSTPELGWQAAFEEAFGQSVEAFYAGFGAQ